MSEQNKNAAEVYEALRIAADERIASLERNLAQAKTDVRSLRRRLSKALAATHQVQEGAAPTGVVMQNGPFAAPVLVSYTSNSTPSGAVQEGGGEAPIPEHDWKAEAIKRREQLWAIGKALNPDAKSFFWDDIATSAVRVIEKCLATPPAPIVSAPVGDAWESARREISKWLNEEPNRPVDRQALAVLCAVPPGVARDAERLEWVMHRLSGKALREIGVIPDSGGLEYARAAIDAAIRASSPTSGRNE